MMQQNVKYDSLTGKVYEELGCPSKSSNKESLKSNNEQDIKNAKNVNNEMSTTTTATTSLSNKESEPLSHHDTRCRFCQLLTFMTKLQMLDRFKI